MRQNVNLKKMSAKHLDQRIIALEKKLQSIDDQIGDLKKYANKLLWYLDYAIEEKEKREMKNNRWRGQKIYTEAELAGLDFPYPPEPDL